MRLRKATAKIVVHHSASDRKTTVEEIRRWHMTRPKDPFEDIGYHFCIRDDGGIVAARDIHLVGAHTLGANEDSIGICVIGDNTRADRSWLPEQILSLRQLIHALRLVYGAIPVYGHRDCPGNRTKTECPGVAVRELLMGGV